ncbi:MAG: transposase [Gammaproteobacteria bacterium]|jgi:putative transposase|nr:transposase [Gammaproteobacteria bacterium]
MSDYRRCYVPGGCYFFTVVTHRRHTLFGSPEHVEGLRQAVRAVQRARPFTIQAMVVLPDHLHAVWQLPEDDADFSRRWRDIKRGFSSRLDAPVNHRGEKAIWQRRFWEHLIRDEDDWRRHVDYVHYNPVKHGLVERPAQWPYSSFHAAVRKGWYPLHWGATEPEDIRGWQLE